MEIKYIFSVILLNQFIGHCSAIIRFARSLSTANGVLENVQLIELVDGEFVKLQQQDYKELLKITLESGNKLFKDRQFPMGSPIFSFKRPTQLSDNPVLVIKNERDKSFHLRQRGLGDCWFLVGLLNLKYHENLFSFIVPLNDQSFERNKYAGIFHFRFWQAGKWVDVVIDDRLQTIGKFLWRTSLKSSNEFWAPLLEKAYAKLNYRSYKELEGGFASVAMQDLSGCISDAYIVGREYKTLFEIIYNTNMRQTMISCGSYDDKIMKKLRRKNYLKMDLGHYYAITAVKIIKKKTDNHEFKLIRLNNPHGSKVSIRYSDEIEKIYTESDKIDRVLMKSELPIQVDGESWILYKDFIHHFESVEICNLTPNSISGDIYTKTNNKKLSLAAEEGLFMGGISSKAVALNDLLAIKPQYRIVITEADEGQEDQKTSSIFISLSLKYQRDLEYFIHTKIGITILSFDESEEINLEKPLRSYLLNEPSYSRHITSTFGHLSKRLNLKLGTYYILPSIINSIKEAAFYLQIMSVQENFLELYDREICMPSITEKIHTLISENIEDKDHQLFFEMAKIKKSYKSESDRTIDFKDLYNIFKNDEFSLNKNCHTQIGPLDDEIIAKLKLLLKTKKFIPKKKLSIESITKILLKLEEEYESFLEQEHRTMISILFMIQFFKHNGYLIQIDDIQNIYHKSDLKKESINFNDFILIALTLKSNIGSYCEGFNAKLSQDLISMVADNYGNYNHYDDSFFYLLRIDVQDFKKIIQFVKQLKEKFNFYASKLYRTVPFTKLEKLLDSFGYELTYNMIATVFHTYGNGDDIFYQEFVQSVVDITRIFAKVPQLTSKENGKSLLDNKNKLFSDCWKDKQANKSKKKKLFFI